MQQLDAAATAAAAEAEAALSSSVTASRVGALPALLLLAWWACQLRPLPRSACPPRAQQQAYQPSRPAAAAPRSPPPPPLPPPPRCPAGRLLLQRLRKSQSTTVLYGEPEAALEQLQLHDGGPGLFPQIDGGASQVHARRERACVAADAAATAAVDGASDLDGSPPCRPAAWGVRAGRCRPLAAGRLLTWTPPLLHTLGSGPAAAARC